MKALVFIFLYCFLLSQVVEAKKNESAGEAEFMAANITGELIANWIEGMEKKPESMGVFQINTNYPLRKEFANVLEVEIIKQLKAREIIRVLSCPECQAPQLRVQEDRVVITKGSPDLETLKILSKRYNVNTFLVLEVYRTKLSLFTTATLFHAGSGEIIASESFKVPALNIRGAATQFVLQLGTGVPLGGHEIGPEESSDSFVGNIALYEELGFGRKGGLLLGIASGNRSSLAYAVPTLGWRGIFNNSSLQSLKSFGIGFATSERAQGFAFRLGYDIFLGSFVGMGLGGTIMIPFRESSSGSENKLYGHIGAHINFTIGR